LRGAVEVVAELAQLLDLLGHRALDLDVALAQDLELLDLVVLKRALLLDLRLERLDGDPLTGIGDLAGQDVEVGLRAHRGAKGDTIRSQRGQKLATSAPSGSRPRARREAATG